MSTIFIDIKQREPNLWDLEITSGDSFHRFRFYHGEMKELARSIPAEFIRLLNEKQEKGYPE